ncbi:MAG: hypothetical protein GX571_04535, partial [Lentisphaerae bacterium]|nr:hypothetical protein [Lentisphaerota bacterium]
MQTEPTSKFPWLTLVLLIVFLVLAWMNVAPSVRARLGATPARTEPVPAPAAPAAPAPGTAPELKTAAGAADGLLRDGERNNIAIYQAVSPSVVSVVNRTLVRGGFFGLQVFEVP